MNIQKILSMARKAITDYDMIKDNDKVCVGLSGGKDSLVLLSTLKAYQRFSPQKFDLMAITIDLGFGGDFSHLKKFCSDLDVEYHIEPSQIKQIVFEERKEKNPCSLCSKIRRGALNTCMQKFGYSTLALGHHADDLIETMLLSMFYEGRLSSFGPTGYMDRTGVTLIRPLIYVYEKDIRACAKDMPIFHNPCPADHHTQREYMKDLIKNIQNDIPFVKERMHAALTNSDRYNLWDKYHKNETIKESK